MTIEHNFVRPTDKFILVDYFPYSKRILLTGCDDKKSLDSFKDEDSIGVWHVKPKNQTI